MRAVLVSESAHLKTFVKQHSFDTGTDRIYTANSVLYPKLLDHYKEAVLFDDFSVQPDWNEVNEWGCEKAYGWIGFCRDNGFFTEFDIPSATALFFSHFLIQGVKNFLFAEKIFADKPSRITVFASAPRTYPQFSGTGYFSYFLEGFAKDRGIPLEILQAEEMPPHDSLKPGWRETLKNRILKMAPFFLSNPKPADLVFLGSWKHHQSLAKKMLSTGNRVMFFESDFHWHLFRTIVSEGGAYCVSGKRTVSGTLFDESWTSRMKSELDRALEKSVEEHYFVWRGHDLSSFVKDQIFSGYAGYFRQLLPVLRGAEFMLRKAAPKMIISEDDYALRGGPAAALARKMNIPYTTVSHANMAVDFKVTESARCFRQSAATIVNSENEKQMYVARGWDPAGFQILGTPRYDRLIQMRASRKPDGRKVPRLLYCANTYFKAQKPDDYGYLGIHMDSFSKVVWPCAQAILKAVEQSNCELVIKPHNPEGLKGWVDFIGPSPAASRIRLISDPHAQIIDLINEADAMILSYWSTTIYEALLCDIPVIYVDVLGRDIASVKDFEAKGLMTVTRTETEVLNAVKHLRLWQETDSFAKKNPFDFEIGWHDGQSTNRAARFILETMQSASPSAKKEAARVL